jgi:hypothetical protein
VEYTPESASRLQPWPRPLAICVGLGWPIVGLVVAGFTLSYLSYNVGFFLGWAMIATIAANSYFRVRAMLRRSLPDNVRTKGPVATLRHIGTTLCITVLLIFVGGPLAFGIGCLILLAS